LGRFSIEIEGVVSEAVDVLCEVRADGGDGVFGDRFATLLPGGCPDSVKNSTVTGESSA